MIFLQSGFISFTPLTPRPKKKRRIEFLFLLQVFFVSHVGRGPGWKTCFWCLLVMLTVVFFWSTDAFLGCEQTSGRFICSLVVSELDGLGGGHSQYFVCCGTGWSYFSQSLQQTTPRAWICNNGQLRCGRKNLEKKLTNLFFLRKCCSNGKHISFKSKNNLFSILSTTYFSKFQIIHSIFWWQVKTEPPPAVQMLFFMTDSFRFSLNSPFSQESLISHLLLVVQCCLL